jgi:Lon protease-like protein
MSSKLSATATAPSALPDTIPIFPLSSVVLLPRARLPLTIFEPRYLVMIEDALAMPGRLIGMIQPNEVDPTDNPAPPIYKIGCAGRLSSFTETDDGRYLIGLTGVCRFDVAKELPMGDKPYRRVQPDWSRFQTDLVATTDAPDLPRKQLLTILYQYFKQRNIDADWKVVEKTPDELLISSLVMICPFAPNERQALLEATDLAARATLLTALLEMAAMPQGDEGEGGARH